MKSRICRLKMSTLALAATVSLIATFGTLSIEQSAVGATQEISLPSGHRIVVEDVGKIYFSKNEIWALAMNYHTETEFDDFQAIRLEAIEVWREIFGRMSEESGLTAAILGVFDEPKPTFFGTRQTRYFVFRKQTDGQWTISNPDEVVAWR